jgi:hypothetical protein
MSFAGILARIDDRLNPIVVKELRQAVQGRFVTVVLLLFLGVQLVFLGFYLFLTDVDAGGAALEAGHGRTVFMVLQSILVVTCLLFLPLYAGVRLGAERSDTNTDLLFITTLRPRSIISGKLSAALVLVLLIFSACAPFMTFTYLLRGLDLFSIVFILALDLFVVVLAVQLALFFGAIPGHWLLKLVFGLVGLGGLLILCSAMVGWTNTLLLMGSTGGLADSPSFWAAASCFVAAGLALMGLLFSWSVALISPPSANRALPSRLTMLAAFAGTGLVFGAWEVLRGWGSGWSPEGAILFLWVIFMGTLSGLQILIAVNEREAWGPRVARTIPRPWWLRPPAFLAYSGSAGGVLLGALLFGLTWLAAHLVMALAAARPGSVAPAPPGTVGTVMYWTPWDMIGPTFAILGILLLYLYGYCLTAVLLRRAGLKIRAQDTWVLVIFLVAVGCAVPMVLSYILAGRYWRYEEQYYWLLNNPVAGAIAVGSPWDTNKQLYWLAAGGWSAFVTLLSLPWFARQWLRFRPYSGGVQHAVPAPVLAANTDLEATRTSP